MTAPDSSADRRWEAIKHELLSCHETELREWGEMDELLLARYLAGKLDSAEETARVEAEIRKHPRLSECLHFLKQLTPPTAERGRASR